MSKITESTKISEMMKKHPETVSVLKRLNVDCFGCLGAEQESVRNLAWSHGLDLAALIEELNGSLKK